MLGTLGFSFQVQSPPETAEPLPEHGEQPEEFVKRAAMAKGAALLRSFSPVKDYLDPLVISADTIVSLGGAILGKPQSTGEAFSFLQFLVGKTHIVTTACALFHEERQILFSVSTEVTFGLYDEALLKAYALTGEGLDKAGGYAIQGKGAFLVQAIRGSFTNVVGLPLAELTQCLINNGFAEAVR